MQTRIREAKAALRKQVGGLTRALSAAERAGASVQACSLLERQAIWKEARSILFFAPMPEELDIWPLLVAAFSAGKAVALPRFISEENAYVACHVGDLKRDIQAGHFGIREPTERCAPISSNRIDLILVPGVAFDLEGRRLGRGKGYYDQLLAMVRGSTCGVGFDEQIVPEIPIEPHDIWLDYLLTPTRWVELDARDASGGWRQKKTA
jgi:5-formyltetrahydrofolate cyclo-ligase